MVDEPEKIVSWKDDFGPREKEALRHVDWIIEWYDVHANWNRRAYWISYTLSISFSGLTPILILWTDLWKPIQALPAALAAISTGLNGIFQWHEHYKLFAWASMQYSQEKSKYLSGSTKRYSKKEVEADDALSSFIQSIDDIIQAETSMWLSLGPNKSLDDAEKMRVLEQLQNIPPKRSTVEP